MYQIGPQEGANKRKIYEKKRKMEALEKDATKAEIHEKSTKKNEKWKPSKRTPQRRKCTKNLRKTKNHTGSQQGVHERKIHEKKRKIMRFKRPDPHRS